MSPKDQERLVKSRYQSIQLCRFTGVIVMILGMWIWTGDILREGGWMALGMPLFLLGVFEALWLPIILARRWKTPPSE